MKKWWIILTAIAIGLLLWLFLYNQADEICIAAGEKSFDPSIESTEQTPSCCNDLTSIQGGLEEEYSEVGSEILGPMEEGLICSDCGNNICEEWEHIYNCPIDCEN